MMGPFWRASAGTLRDCEGHVVCSWHKVYGKARCCPPFTFLISHPLRNMGMMGACQYSLKSMKGLSAVVLRKLKHSMAACGCSPTCKTRDFHAFCPIILDLRGAPGFSCNCSVAPPSPLPLQILDITQRQKHVRNHRKPVSSGRNSWYVPGRPLCFMKY